MYIYHHIVSECLLTSGIYYVCIHISEAANESLNAVRAHMQEAAAAEENKGGGGGGGRLAAAPRGGGGGEEGRGGGERSAKAQRGGDGSGGTGLLCVSPVRM